MLAPQAATWVRLFLLGSLMGMAGLALAALRHRRLPPRLLFLWGLVAMALPALGPFAALLWAHAPRPRRRP